MISASPAIRALRSRELLPGNAHRRDRTGVEASAEADYVPGGSTTRNVEAGNQRFVVKGDDLPLLYNQNLRPLDER